LRDWFTTGVTDYVKICDPYFGVEDLEILQMISSTCPKCSVHILTSKRHQENRKIEQPWEESFRRHWHVKISDQLPPNTEIVIVGIEDGGDLPIHDRWWLRAGAD